MNEQRKRYEAMMDFAEQWIRKGEKHDIDAALAAIEWCKEYRISEAGNKIGSKDEPNAPQKQVPGAERLGLAAQRLAEKAQREASRYKGRTND
jgi:hypothetical protein